MIFILRNHRKICVDDDYHPHIGRKKPPIANSFSSVQKMHVWRSRVEDPWVKARRCARSPARAPTRSPGQLSLMNKEAALCPLVLLGHGQSCITALWLIPDSHYQKYTTWKACREQAVSLNEKLVCEWICYTPHPLSLGHLTVACSIYPLVWSIGYFMTSSSRNKGCSKS